MKLSYFFLSYAVLMAALACSSPAAAVTVPDFSFETPGGNFAVNNNPTVFSGWTVTSPSYYGDQTIVGQFSAPGNSDGSAYLFMNLDGTGTAYITSDTVATIADNTTYSLTVALGNHNQTGPYGDPGNMSISLLANGVLIPGAITTVTNGTIANGDFVDYSASFSTALVDPLFGENLSIRLETDSGGATQASYDNVRLDATAIPEPSTYAMLLGGLGLIVLVARLRHVRTA